MTHHLRSGAALIIVLLILLALMVLGLPFLFSQSSGLAGARSFQAAQAAHIYRQSAENLGLAIAAYTNEGAWKQTTGTDLTAQIHTALYLYLKDSPQLQAALIYENPNRLSFDAAKLPDSTGLPGAWNQPAEDVRIGVTISDESGLLDANTLSPHDWKDLFAQPEINIPDWDDQQVVVTSWAVNEGPDGDTTGELADALVHRRLVNHRFTRLEQLMEPDPQTYRGPFHPEFRKRLSRAEIERLRPYLSFHNPAPGRDGQVDLGSVVYTDVSPSANYLPPKVWMDIPGNIVADGQWVWAEEGPKEKLHEGVIRAPNNYDNLWITYDTWNLRPKNDSAILWQAPPALNLHQMSPLIRALPAYKFSDFPNDPILPMPDIATGPVTYYGAQLTPSPNLQTNNALPTGFLQPWYHVAVNPPAPQPSVPPRARQPIDLRSSGAIRIEAAATIRNHLGDLTAQESRTVIMQAVPQETTLERRWLTQGQFEPLVDQHLTSQIVTWPNATARATDLVPDDIDPAVKPTPLIKTNTGISFKTLPTLATSAPTHLEVTWRAPLGVGTNLVGADALKDNLNKDARNVTGEIEKPDTAQTAATNEGLFPDGVRIGPSKALAYDLTDPANGAFVYRSPPAVDPAPPNPNVDTTIGPRHLSFCFQPQTDWTATAVVTLMELRPSPNNVTTVATDIDDAQVIIKNQTAKKITDCQNYLGVLYDPKQNMLVLAYTPPSISIAAPAAGAFLLPGPLTWPIQNDNPLTADVDERCLPGVSPNFPLVVPRCDSAKMAAWSPTLLPNRIMTCYKLGRRLDTDGTTPIANIPERGRWYNLQIAMGDGRPGGMSIILDGNVGNDVGVVPATEYFVSRKGSRLKGPWPGDHLTFPNLILTQTLTAIDKTVNDPATAKKFVVPEITVEMPGFSSFGNDDYSGAIAPILSPSMTLPPRGSVLIGDEYIRYEDIKDDTAALHKAKLLRCWRGDRQNTWTWHLDPITNLPLPLDQLPSTQNHAINDRVIADGMRFKLSGTNNLYQGGAPLAENFKAGNVADAFALTSKLDSTTVTHLLTVPFTLTGGGTFNQAPDSGYAYVKPSFGPGYIFWYVKSGSSITLSKPDTSDLKIPDFASYALPTPVADFIDNSGTPVLSRIWLASLEIQDLNAPMGLVSFGGTLDLANSPYSLIQLLDTTTGHCEWLHYTERIAHAGRIFFINRNAWYYDVSTESRTRGMERTVCTAGSIFPRDQTLVLPVITDFEAYGKLLATGDVVTLVPRTYGDPAIKSAALTIRYSTNDGYDGNPALPKFNDTVNGRFAFTMPLASLLGVSANGADYDIVMGSGLTTRRDLTPLTSMKANLPLAALPRLDAHIESPTAPARIIFGSPDTARGGIANTTTLMAIDAPAAGPWDSSAGRVRRVFDSSGASLSSIPASGGLPCFIWVTGNIFQNSEPLSLVEIGGEVFACERLQEKDWPTMITALTALTTGPNAFPDLLRVGGTTLTPAVYLQTFPVPVQFARLVGRGQLGSRPMAHALNDSPKANQLTDTQKKNFGNLDYGPECMTLPVGPVRYLDDSANLVANSWFTLKGKPVLPGSKGADEENPSFVAPYGLVVEASPTAQYPWDVASEVISIGNYDERQTIQYYDPNTGLTSAPITNANFGKRITPKWLRGLYNTDATKAWADQNGLKPLVIGWWPRYPSSYPSLSTGTGTPGTLTAQHLRCRFYPWIGFPMNLHGARFDNSLSSLPQVLFDPALAANQVLTETSGLSGGLPSLQMEVRAMAGAIDGVTTVLGAIGDTGGSSYSDWSRMVPSLPVVTPGGWIPVLNPFPWNTGGPDTAKPTTGVEVRVSFRYTGVTSGDLSDIARAANRAPLISGFKLRAHAPVATLAVEDAR